jgi:hypothetical protein
VFLAPRGVRRRPPRDASGALVIEVVRGFG